MKIQIISDTHFEFHRDGGNSFIKALNPTQDVDALIHAGDMCVINMLEDKIKAICDKYTDVVYVTGNHEYYHTNPKYVHDLLEDLKVKIPNFHWLNKNVVEINDSDTNEPIKFAGATMWFGDNVNTRLLTGHISDFREIQNFVPWVYEENKKTLNFFTKIHEDVNVIVTHHLPHPKCISHKYIGNQLNCYFLCDVEDLLGYMNLWVHGHTHGNVDFQVRNTRVICNPYGYGRENTKFDYNKIVEVGSL